MAMTIGIKPSMRKSHLHDSNPAFPLSCGHLACVIKKTTGSLAVYLVYPNSKETAHARSKRICGVKQP